MEKGAPYSIIYGSDEAVRDQMAARMAEKLGYPPEKSFQIGAVIAANTGPKVVGVIYRMKG